MSLTSRDRFLRTLNSQPVDRPPVWLMRQAGRYLPEYRALKQKYSFVEMVRTPDLTVEVTLQPLRRFRFDAAIVFSDILIVPEAMGQPYYFREEGGIGMEFALKDADSIRSLQTDGVGERLQYLSDALKILRRELTQTALLGFGGSPWTLATYMVEGGSSKDFSALKRLYFSSPKLFEELMSKLTQAVIELFKLQIMAGVDAVQIFDSWGAACPAAHYEHMSLRWIRQIIAALPAGFPVIVYAKGMCHHASALLSTGCRGLSLDWTADMAYYRSQLGPDVVLQGNLDPVLLDLEPAVIASAARELIKSWQGKPGHIVNLGHGIHPTARIDSVSALVEAVEASSD